MVADKLFNAFLSWSIMQMSRRVSYWNGDVLLGLSGFLVPAITFRQGAMAAGGVVVGEGWGLW